MCVSVGAMFHVLPTVDTAFVLNWLGILLVIFVGGGGFLWLISQESRHPRIDDRDELPPWP